MAPCSRSMASGSGKVLIQKLDAKFGSGSGKVLIKKLAAKFRKSVALRSRLISKLKKEEKRKKFKVCRKSGGLHIVVSVWTYEEGHRLYASSSYCQNWSRQSIMWSPFSTRTITFIGSCNGLLCFEYHADNISSNQWVVWEPSTNKLQVIPQPLTSVCSSKERVRAVGHRGGSLHFDSQSGDYKLFDFMRVYYSDKDEITEHAMVYSVKNNVWKEVSYPRSEVEGAGEGPVTGAGSGICVNGVCYWVGVGVGEWLTDYSWLISYDFATEKFSKIKCPSSSIEVSETLVEMDGSPCFLVYPGSESGRVFLKKADLSSSSQEPHWALVDGFVFEIEPDHKPLWFGKRHGRYYLLLQGPHGNLREYDYTRKKLKHIPQEIFPCSGSKPGKYTLGSCTRRFRPTSSVVLRKYNYFEVLDNKYHPFTYETNTDMNNANIWHSSSFHSVEVQDRFSVYADLQRGDN